ncbi:MAG TPA: glycosyltransferase family 39 protein [Blastocatellia bacterium]|nr:glycosyltransferase family 39 protein [Blastocatellia bacterium]
MRTHRQRDLLIPLALLCLVAFLFLYVRLGAMALIGPDEPRYAQVAREMLERRDFITPTIGGQPWLEKPILLYWLMAASFSAFGVTERAARLPSAVSALVLLVLIYFVGCRIRSPRFGLLSGLVLLINPMLFSFARGASTDMLLSATLSGGLALFFLATMESRTSHRRWLTVAAFACFGLACLAKGVIGLLLPALVIGAFFLSHPPARQNRRGELLMGLAVTLLVCSLWYVPVVARHGWSFIQEFFISHHIERFLSNKFRHPGPIYYYLPVVLAGAFPWTPVLILSLTRCPVRDIIGRVSSFFRHRARSPEGLRHTHGEGMTSAPVPEGGPSPDPALAPGGAGIPASKQSSDSMTAEQDRTAQLRIYSFLWLVIPVLFFSFSGSKLPGYILPVMPALAFLVALELEAAIQKEGVDRGATLALWSIPILIVVVLIVLCFYSQRVFGLTVRDIASVIVPGAVTAVILFAFILKKQVRGFIATVVIGLVGIALPVLDVFQPRLEERESLRPLAMIVQQQAQPEERLIGYFTWHHSLTFYTNARSLYDGRGNVIIAESPESLHRFISSFNARLVLTSERAWRDLQREERFTCRPLATFRDRILLRCRTTAP